MDYEEYKRKALEPIVNYIESVMASYSKEELEARIKEALPEKESEDERIRKEIIDFLTDGIWNSLIIDKVRQTQRYAKWIAYLEKQKEQKPSPGIYWHAIKEGDTLPCRAYLWTTNYEQYYDCFEGRLIPNVENVTAGADMWYLPVDDVYNLPREGVDELPKEQKPEVFKIPATPSVGIPKTPPAYKLDVKPAEWSEEDENIINGAVGALEAHGHEKLAKRLKSLRPKPHWKPSGKQMRALENCVYGWQDSADGVLESLYNELSKL